jgi:hypothetical protein
VSVTARSRRNANAPSSAKTIADLPPKEKRFSSLFPEEFQATLAEPW